MMKIIGEDKYLKTWIDDQAPIIFTRLLKAPESSVLVQELCERHLNLIEGIVASGKGAAYSICDAYALQPFTFDLLVDYFMGVMPRQIKAGLTYKAFVRPRSMNHLVDLQAMMKKMDHQPVGIFDDFDQASQFVYAEWAKIKAMKPVRPVSVL
jgi:hypothetical protein